MNYLMNLWNRFWFRTGVEYNPLGLLRMMAVGFYAVVLPGNLQDLHRSLDVPQELFIENFGLHLLPIPYPLPAAYQLPFTYLMYLTMILAFFGVATRLSLALFTLGALYLASGVASLTFFNHEIIFTLNILLILIIAPGTEKCSVDELIRWWRRRRERPLASVFTLQGTNAWGYRLILVTLCVVYMTAGVSKLRYSDGRWLTGETLSFYLSRDTNTQLFYGAKPTEETSDLWKSGVGLIDHGYGGVTDPLIRPFAEHLWLMSILSIGVVLLELGAFLLLFPPLVRTLFLLAALSMHKGIGFSMGLPFVTYQAYILLLIDWPWLIYHLRPVVPRLLRFQLKTG